MKEALVITNALELRAEMGANWKLWSIHTKNDWSFASDAPL